MGTQLPTDLGGAETNGRHRIRTCDFYRVRMVRQAENHTPQALTNSIVCTDCTVFKGSVHFSEHFQLQ
jgi:hypothetical protein